MSASRAARRGRSADARGYSAQHRWPYCLSLPLGDDPYVWEYPSLIRLQEHCVQHPDNYVWYIHSKGARYDPKGTGPEDHKVSRALQLIPTTRQSSSTASVHMPLEPLFDR